MSSFVRPDVLQAHIDKHTTELAHLDANIDQTYAAIKRKIGEIERLRRNGRAPNVDEHACVQKYYSLKKALKKFTKARMKEWSILTKRKAQHALAVARPRAETTITPVAVPIRGLSTGGYQAGSNASSTTVYYDAHATSPEPSPAYPSNYVPPYCETVVSVDPPEGASHTRQSKDKDKGKPWKP